MPDKDTSKNVKDLSELTLETIQEIQRLARKLQVLCLLLRHQPGGCTTDMCLCFTNGYEHGRQDEREEPGEPVRDESRD
jgi:hypothetical protein